VRWQFVHTLKKWAKYKTKEEEQMFKKKQVRSLMFVLVLAVAAIGGGQYPSPVRGEEPFPGVSAIPRVFAMVPEWSGFIDSATEWNFGSALITASPEVLEARFVRAQIGGRSVTSVADNEWTKVVRGGGEIERALDRYEELHNSRVRSVAQRINRYCEDAEREYYTIRQQIYTRFEQLAEAGEKVDGMIVRIPSVPLALGETAVVELIFEVRRAYDPTQKHRLTVPTSVTRLCPLGIEDDSVWVRGDLHIHSIYSQCTEFETWFPNVMPDLYQMRDATPNLRGRGYHFVYMADHVGISGQHLQRFVCLCPTRAGLPPRCNTSLTWNCYVTNTQRATIWGCIAFFPGAEYSTAGHGGHALIYGLESLLRSDGHVLFDGQLTGPQLVNARPSGSNLAIAHPASHTTFWLDWGWPIRHYRGVELMAPCTSNELHWWRNRAFTTEALNDALNKGIVASARTGSDYHHGHTFTQTFYQAFTYVHLPVSFDTWRFESWAVRRSRVNTALTQGRTVASRRGGFARLNMNGHFPGTVLRNIPANTALNVNIMLRPTQTGTYELRVYRNANILDATLSVPGTANQTTFHNFTISFPGTTHGYWLRVIGSGGADDIIYSTPIIVSSQ
jgi:hypothetical protein